MSKKNAVSSKKSETSKNNVEISAKELVMQNVNSKKSETISFSDYIRNDEDAQNDSGKKLSKKAAEIKATNEASIKYAQLSLETVKQLDGLAETNVKSWMDMGKLVHEFYLKVTDNATRWVNAFEILAKCPGSKHQEAQLRNYDGAYKLAEAMREKGWAVSVNMTVILAVVHSGCNFDQKLALIKEAAKEELTVSETKERAKEIANPVKPKDKKIINYEKSVEKAKKAIANCFDALSAFGALRGNKSIPEDLRNDLGKLLDFVNAQGFITPTEISLKNININVAAERMAA